MDENFEKKPFEEQEDAVESTQQEAVQNEVPQDIESEPFVESAPVMSSGSYTFNDEAFRKATEKKKKGNPLKVVAIVAGIVCALGIIGVSIFGVVVVSQRLKNGLNNTVNNVLDQTSSTAQSTLPIKQKSGDGLSIPQIYEKVSPSVVSIVVDNSGLGSGIIMSADGYILTNAHVVLSGTTFKVITNTNKEYNAVLKGKDTKTDLAVLKIDATGLPAAEFGDSSKILVGEGVVAIGSPYDLEFASTITNGIVSAYRKNISLGERKMDLIQTNADINRGNSGGPLVNDYGQVIGITSSKIMGDSQGIGFAIPINVAKPIIDGLMTDGYVKGRPMLGINGSFITAQEGERFGYPQGIYVDLVDPSSDAYAKGLTRADVITKINDKAVESFEQFSEEKDKFKVGDTIKITYVRAGKTATISVKLAESKPEN